ncbi:porin family protein [Gynurincola endophyticus]|uniref:porin family protein n=1 Tax=Gynurincola endophyticus TaxID=2479004 RepID=UPI000F8F53D3|nr:porin family protein [Gynurincola endophyticus]
MKSIIILVNIAAMLMFSNNIQAQRTFNIGVEGGLNIPKYYGKTRNDQVFFTGLRLGASVQTALTETWTLQSGLLYTQKGTKFESVFEQTPGGYAPDLGPLSNRYHFIELPIHGIYNFSGKLMNFYAGAGPYFGYLAGITTRTDEKKSKVDFSESNYYKRFDAGLSILAGYKVTEKLSVQLGLKNGFVTISKLKDAGIGKQYHRSFEVSARYSVFNK